MKIERALEALKLRASGLTLRAVGQKIGRKRDKKVPISGQRVQAMVAVALRFLAHPEQAEHPLQFLRKKVV